MQGLAGVQTKKSMEKHLAKLSLLNLSVEEENLAAIPFAVLERRVGKRIGKLEISGTKTLPDGSEVRVTWQIQGNSELGLPTEQDLDIFVALGVLTFRSNFSKTISFTGRELAKILDIGAVHGKFYNRLKMAMDRFIPLRFRALAENERQEEVKWVNVFQEASFSLDRLTGRCIGSVTWTDKLIQSMDSGLFRVLNAGSYMELDGITAKHLYRFLAVAFEKTDVVLIDLRKLAREHLGIFEPPKYLSRLMQTLEPTFEQLKRIEVLSSHTIVSAENWRVALRRHPNYLSQHKTLQMGHDGTDLEWSRAHCNSLLTRAGLSARAAEQYCSSAASPEEFHALERSARLLQVMVEEDVLPHVGVSFIRKALDPGVATEKGTEQLDWYEIALEVCRQKKRAGQSLKNAAGLFVKILKDDATRRRLVSVEQEAAFKEGFRRRENAARRLRDEEEERTLIIEYEQFREKRSTEILDDLPESVRAVRRKEKLELLKQQDRFQRLSSDLQDREIFEAIRQDIAKREVAPFHKWRLRRRAQQAVLPFEEIAVQC
jgi:hypothetical protein